MRMCVREREEGLQKCNGNIDYPGNKDYKMHFEIADFEDLKQKLGERIKYFSCCSTINKTRDKTNFCILRLILSSA